jgi:hypothetical protein
MSFVGRQPNGRARIGHGDRGFCDRVYDDEDAPQDGVARRSSPVDVADWWSLVPSLVPVAHTMQHALSVPVH